MTQPANKRNDYVGVTGTEVLFPFTFYVPVQEHLKVVTKPLGGVEATIPPNQYSVTMKPGGGDVLLTSPIAIGQKLSVLLKPPILQDEDIKNNGSYYREAQEKSLDRLVRQILSVSDDAERALRLPETEAGSLDKTLLPALADRINRYMYCDGAGKITFVSAAPGVGGGGGGGSAQRSDYQGQLVALPINTPTNVNIAPMPGQVTVALGMGLELELVVTVPGVYEVTLYADPARTRAIADYIFDTTQKSYDTVPFGFISSDASGTIYAKVTNRNGGPGDVTLNVKLSAVALVGSVSAQSLAIALGVNSGLEAVVESLVTVHRVKTKALGGVQRGPDGLEADATMLRTSGAGQTKSDLLTLTGGLKLGKALTAGPPTGGAHTAGEIHTDLNGNHWLCTADGNPGTWAFWGSRKQTFSGVTGSVAAGASVNFDLTTYARAGLLLRARFWASLGGGAAAFDLPFQVRLFSKEIRRGSDQIGLPIEGHTRHILTNAAALLGATTLSVASIGSVMPADLIRIDDYIAGNVSEFNRVAEVTTVPQVLLENGLLAPLNSPSDIHTVDEVSNVGWWNDTLTPAEKYKLFATIKNQHASLATPFRYEIEVLNLGSFA